MWVQVCRDIINFVIMLYFAEIVKIMVKIIFVNQALRIDVLKHGYL